MRIIRFLKLLLSCYYHAFDFKRRFPESHIIQPILKECSVCWYYSKKVKNFVGYTQEYDLKPDDSARNKDGTPYIGYPGGAGKKIK